MQVLSKRLGVFTGFVLMLAIVAVNAIAIRRQLGTQVQNRARVTHTQQVLFELSEIESILKDAETGQRGFLYTNDMKYLSPYTAATVQIESQLDNLAQLTTDNSRQQARVLRLRYLVANKLSELGETVELARSGQINQANTIVRSDFGLILMNEIRALLAEMRNEENSLNVVRSDAYKRSVRITILCIYLTTGIAAAGLILLAFYILREIELRSNHARQMLEREEWFRVTLTSLGDAVIATDELGKVTYLNPLAEQLIGAELASVKGRAIQEVFPIFNEGTFEPVENPVGKVMELGRVVGLANHTVLKNTDGTFIPIEDSASPIRDANDNLIGVVLVFRDATQERRTQEMLRKSERLTTAARMSATVAHEINNPLESVGNLIYLVKKMPDIPFAAIEQLDLAEQELERVSHITSQTLGFYRESKRPEQVDVPALVDYVLRLHSNKLKTKSITVEREFEPCPPIQAVSGELNQAISNLIANAADAVGENGTIRVKLACVERDDGRAIRVIIEDDGPGFAPEHAALVFEPFFTTKKDVGTGLGLWVAKEVIDRHKGAISIHSRDDGSRGALIQIMLPCEVSIAEQQVP
jgi:PAS domain S-box-containing protein